MAEPADIVVPMLCEVRNELAVLHAKLLRCFDEMDRRFDAIEREQQLIEAALVARRALLQQAAARIGSRIKPLEQRVQKLEAQK
jgi:hypothetical protein